MFLCTLQVFAQEDKPSELESENSEVHDSEKTNIETDVFRNLADDENKIYKDYNLDTSLKENIIPKEKLLYKNYNVIHNKSKNSKKQNIKSNLKLSNQSNSMRPWFFVLFSIVLLVVIFKVIKSRKV